MIDSAEEFIRLRFSDDPEECRRAASESAPLAIWMQIIDEYPDARVWVAQNKMVPPEILSILADDPSKDVRFMVSMKNALSVALLARLARDEDDSIRLQIARHRRASLDILRQLAEDPWPTVARVAAERLDAARE